MNWQALGNFIIALAPYVVALAIGIGSWIWGSSALKGKDDVIKVLKEQIGSQKDLAVEVTKAKDAHIQTLEQLRPARLQQDLEDLHKYYAGLVDRTKQQADERVKELESKHIPEERQRLEDEIGALRLRLAQAEAGRDAAERLAGSALSPYGIFTTGTRSFVRSFVPSNSDIVPGSLVSGTSVQLFDPDEIARGNVVIRSAYTEPTRVDGDQPPGGEKSPPT